MTYIVSLDAIHRSSRKVRNVGAIALMTDEERPEIYTVEEVAKKLRINPITLRRWIKQGKVPFFKVGREYRIHQSTLDAMMDTRFTKDDK